MHNADDSLIAFILREDRAGIRFFCTAADHNQGAVIPNKWHSSTPFRLAVHNAILDCAEELHACSLIDAAARRNAQGVVTSITYTFGAPARPVQSHYTAAPAATTPACA